MVRARLGTWGFAGAACLGLVSCVHPPQLPPSASSPVNARPEVSSSPSAEDLARVAFYDLCADFDLKPSLKPGTSERVCTDSLNRVVVKPGAQYLLVNGKKHSLSRAIRWQKGVLYLPSEVRGILAETLQLAPIAEVRANPERFDGTAPSPRWRAHRARQAAVAPNVSTRGLPVGWKIRSNRRWRSIVIHHSATDSGDATVFHRAHKKKWTNGLGYHFVIGNGTTTPDGFIQVGPRWTRQNQGIHGAHAGKNNPHNRFGIGICLVGDFSRSVPSPRQLASLRRLVKVLVARYRISRQRIYPHKAVRRKGTNCPGSRFPFQAFLRSLGR